MDILKLLIIEDDADQRELIGQTLRDHFGPITVAGATSCAKALEQDLAEFDLILSDYNLPDGTGMNLLEQVRQRCDTPVIIVTGQNSAGIAAEAVQAGATDYVVKAGDYLFTIPLVVQKNLAVARMKRENESLRRELEAALHELRDKNTQLEQSLRRLQEVAATDPLTGLYNRRHFGKVLEQLFAEAERCGNDLSCVMIDLDGYKLLNDTYGHQLGDQLLVAAGKVITANMRRMDVAARYGGDELVLLLPQTSTEEAARVARRVAEGFCEISKTMLDREQGATMSMGIASLRRNAPAHGDHLVAMADTALYEAKDAGRNQIVASDRRQGEQSRRRWFTTPARSTAAWSGPGSAAQTAAAAQV